MHIKPYNISDNKKPLAVEELLSKNYPSTFIDHITQVNNQSLKQLIMAILREQLLAYRQEDATLIFCLPNTGCKIYCHNVKLASMLRLVSIDRIVLHKHATQQTKPITNPLELLEILKIELEGQLDLAQWDNFTNEIVNHLQNALLARCKEQDLKNELSKAYKNQWQYFIFAWLKNDKMRTKHVMFFEQWAAFRGHPYHPCCKTKLGFSPTDVLQYSPEHQSEIAIMLTAVHRNFIKIESLTEQSNFTDWFSIKFPAAWQAWQQALTAKNLDKTDYIPVPLHPWQAENIVKTLFKDYVTDNIIILLEDVVLKTKPTLSFRTVAPTEYLNAPHIKMPVSVQATSVMRTFSAIDTENAIKASRILYKIFNKENHFAGQLNILLETYGLYLKQVTGEQAKHFAVIFPENPNEYFISNELAIVVAALFEQSPVSDNNLFIELMKIAGFNTYQHALEYFHHYIKVLLSSYLDIYLLYGISLEGHQQNTLAVFESGHLERFIARDCSGLSIHINTLLQHGFTAHELPKPPLAERERTIPRRQLLHAVYQSHIGEIILLLAKHFNCGEQSFWQIVKQITEQRFNDLRDKMESAVWQNEYQAILQDDWPLKALLRMRLQKEYNPQGLFLSISNPLAS